MELGIWNWGFGIGDLGFELPPGVIQRVAAVQQPGRQQVAWMRLDARVRPAYPMERFRVARVAKVRRRVAAEQRERLFGGQLIPGFKGAIQGCATSTTAAQPR